MKRFGILMLSSLVLFTYKSTAQNISGIINNYASVTSISGTGIKVNSAAAFQAGDKILLIQMKGASVDQTNSANFGNITSMGGAGTFEFLNIQSVAGQTITSATALTHTYNSTSGSVQIVRVPRFCTPVVNDTLTCATWTRSTGTGGVLAFEAGTLTLNSDIIVDAQGFAGGKFVTGTYLCDNGNFASAAGVDGGKKGESISAYLSGLDGAKGKQANGGGASNSGNSGGGGGAHAGAGGLGGNQYSGCGNVDERGLGGVSITPSLSTLFLGGGGGGGFEDNNLTASNGGNGGGIIYIRANAIISNGHVITANGGSVTVIADAEGAGGGGAGGTIFIECNNISGNLQVRADGGSGGSSDNSVFVVACHGTGGGGGGGVFAFTPAALPTGVSYSSMGGPAGVINNTTSACYGTTNGAAAGGSGTLIPGLPATLQALTIPTLTVTQTDTEICKGNSVSLTVSGASSYSWSTGSASTSIVVSPTVTNYYTVSGKEPGTNACEAGATATVTVYDCTGITNHAAELYRLNAYPNPTNGKLFVETGSVVTLFLYDATGKKIMEETIQKGSHSINIENYPEGVYLLKSVGNSETRKISVIKTN